MTQQARGPFTQLPASLWTYPGLSISERWLAATITRLCWKPGPQPLSYHQLAQEAGLTQSALSPTAKREGMIAHLEREGLVNVSRPLNEHGQVQRGKPFLIEPTTKLWDMNRVITTDNSVIASDNSVIASDNSVIASDNSVIASDNSVYHYKGVSVDEKRDEEAPKIYKDSNTLEDNKKGEEEKPAFENEESQKVPIPLFSHSPKEQEEVHDPRSMTPAQQKRLDARAREQERETWWREAERILQTDFTPTDRREPYHTRGLDKLQRGHIPLEQIIAALEALDDFQVKNFTWENFAKWRPGLLSKKRMMNTNGKKAVINGDDTDMYQTILLPGGMIRWQGQVMTEDDAYDRGYNGGFERYV